MMLKKQIKIQFLLNLRPKIDLGRTLDEKPLRNRLVKPMHKFSKLVIKTNSKVQKPKTYNKTINNSIYRNK